MRQTGSEREKIKQVAIGFRKRQLEFLNKYRGININALCRNILDEQIRLIDPSYLQENEIKQNERRYLR